MRKKALGTYDISKICQVAPITVGRWIEEGKLPYFTTGGGHRRVWEEDLVEFLKAHNYPVPKKLKIFASPNHPYRRRSSLCRRLFIRKVLEKNFPTARLDEADGWVRGRRENYDLGFHPFSYWTLYCPGWTALKCASGSRLNKSLKRVKILAITGTGVRRGEKESFQGGRGFVSP